MLCELSQPDAVGLVGAAIRIASAAQQRGIDVVELRTARQRIEPDVLVALALVERSQAQPALEKEPERTSRGALQLGHGIDRFRFARIERRSGCRCVAVELREIGGLPPE